MPNLLTAFSLLVAAAIGPADSYPRQPLHVEHYRFAIVLSDGTDRINGEATVRMRLLAPNLRSVTLDLADSRAERKGQGMQVSSVTSQGAGLVFVHSADRLTSHSITRLSSAK